jgi:hypothetical protein
MWDKVVRNDVMCSFSIRHHVSNRLNALVLFVKVDMNNCFSLGLTLGCMATISILVEPKFQQPKPFQSSLFRQPKFLVAKGLVINTHSFCDD